MLMPMADLRRCFTQAPWTQGDSPRRSAWAYDQKATAESAAALPDSRGPNAFNTNFAATLASGTIGGQPTTVLIAGDDAQAKSQGGFENLAG